MKTAHLVPEAMKLPPFTGFFSFKHHTKPHANGELGAINSFLIFGKWNDKV